MIFLSAGQSILKNNILLESERPPMRYDASEMNTFKEHLVEFLSQVKVTVALIVSRLFVLQNTISILNNSRNGLKQTSCVCRCWQRRRPQLIRSSFWAKRHWRVTLRRMSRIKRSSLDCLRWFWALTLMACLVPALKLKCNHHSIYVLFFNFNFLVVVVVVVVFFAL
jgi:hypothetical protein